MFKPKRFFWWRETTPTFEAAYNMHHSDLNNLNLLWRSSHRKCSVSKGVLRNFPKFAGKYLCQSFFFNKVVGWGLQVCNFLKKETLAQVFSVNFAKFLRTPFLKGHLWATASDKLSPFFCLRNCSFLLIYENSFFTSSYQSSFLYVHKFYCLTISTALLCPDKMQTH